MNNFLCDKECPKEKPYEIIESNECIEYCNSNDLFNGKCKLNNNNPEIKDDMISNIKNEITTGNLDYLIKKFIEEEKEDIYFKEKDNIFQITSTENQNNKKNKNEKFSIIKLGECEDKLRNHYNISKNKPLLIFKIDIYVKSSLTPKVEYEVYDSDTKKQLNLTFCNNTKINILLPASIKDDDIIKYNASSEYYNDICYIYTTDEGTDITLNDRQKEYNKNNMSLCESNCDYIDYNKNFEKAECECEVKIIILLMS